MMKQVSIDEARKAHENGLAILLLGDTWNEKDEISVEIGGEVVMPTDDFTLGVSLPTWQGHAIFIGT